MLAKVMDCAIISFALGIIFLLGSTILSTTNRGAAIHHIIYLAVGVVLCVSAEGHAME